MEINLLEYYLRIYAFISNLYSGIPLNVIKNFLTDTLLKDFNQDISKDSLNLFDDYYEYYSSGKPLNANDLSVIIVELNSNTPHKLKFGLVLRLLLFEKIVSSYISVNHRMSVSAIIEDISVKLGISGSEFINCKAFISEDYDLISDYKKLLIIAENRNNSNIPFLKRNHFEGQLIWLYIDNHNIVLFIYKGTEKIYCNNHEIHPDIIYFFNKGSVIRGNKFEPVYYNQIYKKFKFHTPVSLKFSATDLNFFYKGSDNGIHNLSLELESEQLVGIIGRSGVGKSTLIKLLTGNIIPDSGSVKINGYDLIKNQDRLNGIIGYVSQDDLLMEDLSVFQNLFFNTKLCFANLSDKEISDKIESLLIELDLFDVKDMKVGNPLNRLLSGGQRKKLNIALELIREPLILFADEPTSGLASSDSEEIMRLFEEQTSHGKIVIVNIHQPSSAIFKKFDKIIVLDKEGYPVYFGNPLDSFDYFNKYSQKVFLSSDVCDVCENINPEAIFKFIEEKKANRFGEYTKERKISPKEWHSYYLSDTPEVDTSQKPLPEFQFNTPSALSQFKIFGKRNILTKMADVQYLLLTLAISPVLAVLLAFLCRHSNNSPEYLFSRNDNIPSFIFMSVIVALFLGLIMSAEEIILDRKILMRESFLKLNILSYINSKVAYVFLVSAFQTYLYVIISNYILEIRGMIFSFWLILFSVSCFANLSGLLISSLFKSVIAIYILVPLIIVPQMLLSGVVINYDRINKFFSSDQFVPFIGDLTASRWAYEALVVTQFTGNEYQKLYFIPDKEESDLKFNLMFVIPEIKNKISGLLYFPSSENKNNLQFINNELYYLKKCNYYNYIFPVSFSDLTNVLKYLDQLKPAISQTLNKVSAEKDSITNKLIYKFGSVHNYLNFKNKYYNHSVADLVLKKNDLETAILTDDRIIRKMEPVYMEPASSYGRSHFLASLKMLGDLRIETFYFNIGIIWMMSFLVYISLVYIIVIYNPFKV